MAINRRVGKFAFCCPHCRVIAEDLRYCPLCGRKLFVVKEGYYASLLGDTVIKTDFPEQKKPSHLGDFPWISICVCSKCKYTVHAGEVCPVDGTKLKKKIVKIAYACKRDRIAFSTKTTCPLCKIPTIKIEDVHTVKFAI